MYILCVYKYICVRTCVHMCSYMWAWVQVCMHMCPSMWNMCMCLWIGSCTGLNDIGGMRTSCQCVCLCMQVCVHTVLCGHMHALVWASCLCRQVCACMLKTLPLSQQGLVLSGTRARPWFNEPWVSLSNMLSYGNGKTSPNLKDRWVHFQVLPWISGSQNG